MSMTLNDALNELLTMLARYSFDVDEAQAIGKVMEALLLVSREQDLEAENMELKKRIVNWRKYMSPTREKVEQVWRGKWVPEMNCFSVAAYHTCSKCGEIAETVETGDEQLSDFCPFCGAPMTDEAVDMMMKRWKEALE